MPTTPRPDSHDSKTIDEIDKLAPNTYTTKQVIIGTDNKPQNIFKNFASLAEVVDYMEYHNLLIGYPAPLCPKISVEHADGSALCINERRELYCRGVNLEGYVRRIESSVGQQLPETLTDPKSIGRGHLRYLIENMKTVKK